VEDENPGSVLMMLKAQAKDKYSGQKERPAACWNKPQAWVKSFTTD
jgi:hypothetical protein